MNDARRVRVLDRPRHLGTQICDPSEGHRPTLVEDFGQVVAVDVLHHEIERPGFSTSEIEHMNGVGVVETRCGLGFAMEASDVFRVLMELAVEQLDRHHFADLHVLDPIHRPHRAAPDRCNHAVAIGDDVARFGRA